ncbi:MAG: P-II family nitrogen regulator [Nitrospirae bacterium]|nr:P-II family nitrogen regulator [Nitrospirota bacterium]
MREIIAIIRPNQAPATKIELEKAGIHSYTTVRALGRSRQGGLRYRRRWLRRSADIRFLPKRLFWIVVEDQQYSAALEALLRANRTGRIGDGKIVVLPVREGYTLRTGERDKEPIR